jgi:hypothetical protein
MPAGSARQTAVKVTAKPKVRPLGAHLRRLDADSARATRVVWRIEPVDELPAGALMRLRLSAAAVLHFAQSAFHLATGGGR